MYITDNKNLLPFYCLIKKWKQLYIGEISIFTSSNIC